MKKLVSFFLIVMLILLLPFIWSGVQFIYHYNDITRLVDTADPLERELPPPIKNMLMLSLHEHTTEYSARLLIDHFDKDSFSGHTMTWNISYASWYFLTSIFVSENDRLTLIVHLAPTGSNHFGLNSTSLVIFNKPLSEISPAEAATLVVLIREPSLYGNQRQLFVERDQFLAKYQKAKF